MSRVLLPPTRREPLPSSVRERILAIPAREQIGLPARRRAARMPTGVRHRILAIPTAQRRTLFERLLRDGRFAIAASALLAVALAPWASATVEPARAATARLERVIDGVSDDAASLAEGGEAVLRGLPPRLGAEASQVGSSASAVIDDLALRVAPHLPPSLATWFGLEPPASPPQTPQPTSLEGETP